jgi:hypothetical protein
MELRTMPQRFKDIDSGHGERRRRPSTGLSFTHPTSPPFILLRSWIMLAWLDKPQVVPSLRDHELTRHKDVLHNNSVVIAKSAAMMLITALGCLLAFCAKSVWEKLNLMAFG